jgi:LysR family hydrogen peroxide-inducible transcriptional activator
MNTDDLSICDLRAVAAVAAHRHFGRAAGALRLAQPTLSARVQKSERALGAHLFERTARRFHITPDGERLLPIVRELLSIADRLGSAAAPGRKHAAPVRLGVIPTLGPYLMPHLLPHLRRGADAGSLTITERPTAALLESLLDGTLDAALLSLPLRSDSLQCLPLFDEPFRLIAQRGSAIAGVDRLLPARLCACDMVLLEDGHCLRGQAVAVCNRRGGTEPRMVTASLETLKYLVAAGSGYSLLPALACSLPKGLGELLRLRDFDGHPPSRRIGLCFRRTLTRREHVLALAALIRSHPPPGVRPITHSPPTPRPVAPRRRPSA